MPFIKSTDNLKRSTAQSILMINITYLFVFSNHEKQIIHFPHGVLSLLLHTWIIHSLVFQSATYFILRHSILRSRISKARNSHATGL